MLVEEMPRSFVKKNNSYSHCPLKKRPVHVMLYDNDVPESVKEEIIDVVTDDIPEPENLSTKPEDLSKSSKTMRMSSSRTSSPPAIMEEDIESAATPNDIVNRFSHGRNKNSMTENDIIYNNYVKSLSPSSSPDYLSPPPPVYPSIVKKERLEIIQHDGIVSQSLASSKSSIDNLNLNGPIEPVAHYPTAAWSRAPLYPSAHHHHHHYMPYSSAYHRFSHGGSEIYPSYPIAAYPSPEHPAVSPPPHVALTCPTIQRPIARSSFHWAANPSSPVDCGLSSPTSSSSLILAGGYSSLRSPPPVTPEDLSSPGSDSGRSSAGSTSAGTSLIGMKIESSQSNAMEMSSNSSSSLGLHHHHHHNSSSSSSPRYQCPDCGKSYSTYSGLSKHQQFHCAAAEGQTKKSFSCKYCEKVYVSMGALKMHIRTHTLPCKCHLCGKAFSRPWLLQGHIRTHTGEKPFSCQHCNRAFADRSNLRAHLQTHSDVKKYSCTSCSKTFSRMSLLTKHQEGGCPGIPLPIGYHPC